MKIRCIANKLKFKKPSFLKKHSRGKIKTDYDYIEVGKEYLVYGIHFNGEKEHPSESTWVEIQFDEGLRLTSAPFCLFEITDSRISKHWIINKYGENAYHLWPESLNTPGYFEDLEDNVPEILEDFKKLKAKMESEFEDLDT